MMTSPAMTPRPIEIDTATPAEIVACERCRVVIQLVEAEYCWRCHGRLCFDCWDVHGECAHHNVGTARLVPREMPLRGAKGGAP